MRFSKLVFAIAFYTLSNFETHAEPIETKSIFKKGAWSVSISHDSNDGTIWCTAQTYNRKRQIFTVAAHDNGSLGAMVIDNKWNIPERTVKFLIDIDYSRWTVEGTGVGNMVLVTLNDSDKSIKFLTELAEGSAVALLNSDERNIATFSLNGSYAGLLKLLDCWKSISTSDPFQSSADPF